MAVEAIWINLYYDYENLRFSKDAMKNMQRLRILCIEYLCVESQSENAGSIDYLPNNLHWFVWRDYPWKSLPQNFDPTRLVHLQLRKSWLHHLWNETKQLPSLQRLDLSYSKSLKRTPDFMGMPNLEYLNLSACTSLEEVHHSLRCSRKLIELNLYACKSLKKIPYVNVESLESLNIEYCSSLEKLPEIVGITFCDLFQKIKMKDSGIREIPSSIIHLQAHLTELDLSGVNNLLFLPSSICKMKCLVKLDVSWCSKLESLPEEIGGLENLEQLHAPGTLISRPPSSIVQLNKLKLLTFAKYNTSVYFVFPRVNEGLRSLEELNLTYCNLIDGGLPEDIGSLSSLKKLYLSRNNFEHLPQSVAQLGALQTLDLSHCNRLTQLPEFPQQLSRIYADWSSDWICNSLFQNISSLQHDISTSDSLSLRVFMSSWSNIPSWFHHQGMDTINLRENWYVSDNFLGFAVCYIGELIDDITAHLDPFCDDDGMSWMTQKLSLPKHSGYGMHFLLVPFAGLWDASKANGKTPNDYRCFRLYSSREIHEFGVRLLYEDELNIGMRRSRDEWLING